MKHIKKSMFISTVLMVVMLIAALSTATFAWYTSNNIVASTATYAGAAEAVNANIGIGYSSTAINTSIKFDPLAKITTNEQGEVTDVEGNLYPVAPITFYSFEGMDGYSGYAAPSDAYISSPYNNLTTARGIIDTTPDNAEDATYIARIINIETASDIKAASSFYHNTAATPSPVVTNLTEADFDNNYKKVYTTTAYAYNNAQTTAPSNNYVTVDNEGKYTYYASATAEGIGDSNLYKITAVYKVDNSATSSDTDKVTAIYAYQNFFNNSVAPIENSYVIAYEVWNTASFNTILKSDQTFQGYAATNNGVANTDDVLIGNLSSTYANLVSTPVYDDTTGFAYVYQIYDAANAGTVDTISGSAFNGAFKFNKGTIDAANAFKEYGINSNNNNASIGTLWSGNESTGKTYSASGKDLVLVTGSKETTTGETTDKFYVYNRGTSSATDISNVVVTLNVEDGIADMLRVAIFVGGKYYGTMANLDGADTTFGPVLKNSKSTDMPTYDALKSVNLGALAHESSFEIQLVVWFDGGDLDTNSAGSNCKFSLSFEAALN